MSTIVKKYLFTNLQIILYDDSNMYSYFRFFLERPEGIPVRAGFITLGRGEL